MNDAQTIDPELIELVVQICARIATIMEDVVPKGSLHRPMAYKIVSPKLRVRSKCSQHLRTPLKRCSRDDRTVIPDIPKCFADFGARRVYAICDKLFTLRVSQAIENIK